MGSSFSCICDASKTVNKQVPVIKEDGELLRFKEGVRVKDILVAYPHHKVIRCSSDKSVLPESFQLSCNQLYFLLPRGLVLDGETYDSLLKLAASRNPKSSIVCSGRNDDSPPRNKDITTKDKEDSRYPMSRWKPALQTITETNSSSTLHSSAEQSSGTVM